MILTNPHPRDDLMKYGINIPLLPTRAVNVARHLRENFPSESRLFCSWQDGSLTRSDLCLAHDSDFIERLFDPHQCEGEILKCYELIDQQGRWHRYDPEQAIRPLSELVAAQLQEAYGTLQCSLLALEHQFCYYLGGGMHHAMSFAGRGFCLVNDLVISIRHLQQRGLIRSAWVIDVDAHKGDGTAEITQDDDSIKTLSIHMADSWPLIDPDGYDHRQQQAVLIPSDVDIEQRRGEDHLYLSRLKAGLETLKQLSPQTPDIALVVNGSDPYEHDILPSTAPLQLKQDQLLQRDQMVYQFLADRNIPSAWVMAGGYGERSWEVHAQFLSWCLTERLFQKPPSSNPI